MKTQREINDRLKTEEMRQPQRRTDAVMDRMIREQRKRTPNGLYLHVMESLRDEDFWDVIFDERELKEIDFARTYSREYDHGTAGHNRLKLISKLFAVLDANRICLLEIACKLDKCDLRG